MYLRNMDEETYFETVRPYLEEGIHSDIDLKEVAKIIQPRIDRLDEIVESVDFFDTLVDYDLEMYRHKKMKTTKEIALKSLKAVYETLSTFDNWADQQAVHDVLLALPAQLEMKNGQVLWPVRTALTGKQFTPDTYFISSVLSPFITYSIKTFKFVVLLYNCVTAISKPLLQIFFS